MIDVLVRVHGYSHKSDYFFPKNSSQRIFNHHRPMFRQSRTALQDRTADLVRRFVSSSKLLLCEWMSNAAKSVWFKTFLGAVEKDKCDQQGCIYSRAGHESVA